MPIWVRVVDIPLRWMNDKWENRIAGLIGDVEKIVVDEHGKLGGPYLRARVAIDPTKPLRRGILLKFNKRGVDGWFRL